MRTSRKKRMGFGLIAVSGLFLFHPVVAFVDVLPDCIGYLLLYLGLSRLADLGSHLAEAQKRFRVMLIIGIGQLLAELFIYGLIGNIVRNTPAEIQVYESPTLILLCSFVLLVLQWYFLIPAFRELFLGMDALAECHGATALCRERKGRTPAERMSRLSVVLVIVLSVAATLPEASILTSIENDIGNPMFPFDWYRYAPLFRLLCGAVASIVGTVWLAGWLRCFCAAQRDEPFLMSLQKRYAEEILSQTGLLTVRRFSAAFRLLGIAVIFAVNLRLSYRAALPSVLFALFAAIGILVLDKPMPQRRKCLVAAGVLGAVDVAAILINTSYLSLHLPEASRYETDAYWHFLAVRLADGLDAIATLLLIAVLLQTLYGLTLRHTSVHYGTEGSEALSQKATTRLHGEFKRRYIWIFVLFTIAAIASLIDAAYRLELPWMWFVSFVFSIASIWQFYSALYELTAHIRYQYQQDGVNKNC